MSSTELIRFMIFTILAIVMTSAFIHAQCTLMRTLSLLESQINADVFKTEFTQIRVQSFGFFTAAFFYSIYCLVLMASNTWSFLNWTYIIIIGFTVSVASILPPAYHIYVHHKIFSESVADAD